MPEVSVIIRTKNEERYVGRVLDVLDRQTYKDFELIVVDDGSTDKTLEIAGKFKSKIVKVPSGKFTYPYASNLGAEAASGKYMVYLSGHSIPASDTWLADGLDNFKDEKVAGVYAIPSALPEASLIE